MHMWKLIGDRVDQWGKDGLSNMWYWLSREKTIKSIPTSHYIQKLIPDGLRA